jgi:copper resistance protein B
MGHCTPSAPPQPQTGATDPHAGHDMGAMAGPEPQPGPPPPEALTGPKHAADAYWGEQASQRGRNILREEHGGLPAYKVFIDRAETRVRDGQDGYQFDAQAWYGGDIDKLWLKSEVEGYWGEKLEHAEVQALWSHAIDPWFDLQAGVRYDPQPGPNRSHLVLGVQGLAPYWWEVEGALFLSNKGDVTARAEAEYDLRITQKLILQPRAEIDLSLQDVPELAIGSGLTNASLGLRLRYQASPLVAPYIGVEYERAFGDTRRLLRAEGEDPGGFNLLAGVRLWF